MRLDSVSPATAHVGSLNTIMLLGLLKTGSAQIDQVIFSDDVSGKAETVSVTLEDQGNEDYVTVNVQGVQMLKAVGDYKVSFRGSDGKVSESKPLSIRDNTSLRQNGYGILAVTQAGGGALTVGAYNSESELKGAGSALITFRGNIAKMDDGSFRVSAGATLNGSLMFIGGPTDTISVSRNGGNVTIAADNLGHLSWNGVPLTPILRVPSNTPRFRIELDSSTIYRTVRNGYGDADIEIIPDTLGEKGLGITLLGVQAETNRIKLYRDAASVGGYIKLGKNMDYIGEASLTLHEMILGTRTGMPLMNVEGKVKVDMSKIVNLGSMNFSGESEFMLQNIDLPGSFGIKAQVELGKALYLEGEFVLMWGVKNGRNIVVPDTIKFFARSNYIGVPLIPPTVVAYLTGFGGGFSGLGKTILGSNTIPQLTLEVSVGLQDALGGAILQIDKVTLKVGLVETSIYAQEARILYGAVTLTDVGAGTGLVEPATGNKSIPDVYFKAGGNASVLNGALKGGLNFNLQVHVNTLGDELRKYFSDSASSTQDGNIIQKMLNAIDFQGKAFIEGGVNFVLGYLEMGFDAALNRQSLSGTIYGSVGTWLGSLDASVSATYYYGRALEFEIFGYPVRVPSRVMNGVNRRIGKPITITPAKPKAFRTMADEPEAEQEHLLLSNLYSYGMYMPDDGVPDGVSTFRALADENELIPGNGRITIDDMDAGNIAVFYSRTRPATINVSHNGAAQAPFNPQWVDGVAGVDIDGDGFEDTGLYAAHYKADSGGNWAFEAEGLLGAMRVNIFKLPSIEGVEAEVAGDGKLEVTWTHDTGETHSGTDMYVNLLLIDADTGDIVSNLIPSDPISPDQSYKNYPEAGISEYNEASIPSSLPSGRYYVSARLLHMATPTYTDEAGTAEAMDDTEPEKMEITLGIQNSPMFNYSNSAAPSAPGNLTVTDAANGALNVTWDKVSDADGYIVTALSGNGAPLDSFGEIDIQSGDVTTVVLNAGLSAYTLTTSGDADSERVSGLEYGKSYQISVRAYSAKTYTAQVENEEGVIEDNVNTIIVPGEAAMTLHAMRTPAIPQLSVTAAGGTLIERKDGNGQVTETLFAVRSHDVTFTVTSNVDANINVYLDDNENGGTLLEAGTNTNELSFSHSFENDGMYALRVEAVNGLDTGSGGMNLLVDTAAPFLDVDNDSFNARDGRFRVTGFAEQEAVLTVDGTPFENITDAERTDGVFTFERAAESIVTTVQLTATDLAGNTSSRLLTIMPLSASEMTASALEPFGSLEVGYPQPAAQTVTVTNSGTNVITLTQPTAVNYEIGALSAATIAANGGTATFTVQPKAGLQAGNYDETIVITGSGGANASVAASFSVTGGEFVPVTSITGVPTAAKAGTSLTLTGTVNPENATNKAITWSVADAGTTGATINGSTLSTPTTGTVIITATVVNGTADGNYAQNFSITVTAGDIDPNNKATIAGGEFNLSENSNGEGWNWDAATKTLTLTGEADLGDIAFVTGDNVTVSLAGDNITAKSVTNTGAGDIAITSAQGKSLTLNAPNGPAISAMGNVTIDSGTVYALTLDVNADAIHAGGSVTISGTANVTAEITSGYGSAVSAGRNINISTSGNVKATADAGISLEAETITITGGKVELVFNEPKGGKAYNKTPEISGGASVTVNEKPLLPEEEEPTPTGPTNPTGPSDPNNPTNPDPTDPGGYEGDGSEGGSGCNSVNLYMMAFLLTLPLLRKPK